MAATRVSDKAFAKSRHRYRDPRTGKRVIGVTSVVGNYADGDKAGRMAAAAVRLGKGYLDEWHAKRDLGSRIHEHIGSWALGKSVDVLDSDEPYLDAFSAFCRAKHPEWIETECAVVHSAGYGGRLDLVGEIDGQAWLLDVKTGKPYLRELGLQLAAYAFAEGIIQYDKVGNASSLGPMPYIEKWGGLYLHDDGTATLIECPLPLEGMKLKEAQLSAFEAFVHLLCVRVWADTQPTGEGL